MNARLKSLAYGMLGSVADAEDVVQEAMLRLHQMDPKPDSQTAFLYRVVSNLCVDRLRREQTRRKHYVGPWLPEPMADDASDSIDMAQRLTMGLMVLMEALSPAERIVYVLREAFDFSFDEIADVLRISPANARQRARRARVRLQGAKAPRTAPAHQKSLLESMVQCVSAGDVAGVIDLMTDDSIAYTDGGGEVSAAIRPVCGAERIAQVMVHIVKKANDEGTLTTHLQQVNGGWGLVLYQHGAVHSCTLVDGDGDRILRIYIVRNPQKLLGLPPVASG